MDSFNLAITIWSCQTILAIPFGIAVVAYFAALIVGGWLRDAKDRERQRAATEADPVALASVARLKAKEAAQAERERWAAPYREHPPQILSCSNDPLAKARHEIAA